MKRVRFVKMSGAGNDFVLIDAAELAGVRTAKPKLAQALCGRRSSIGADGLLVLRRSAQSGVPSLEYFNADGSEAFCANGSRCAAWYIHRRKWAGRAFAFDTASGRIRAVVTGPERVRIHMPQVRDVRLGLKVSAAGREWTVAYLNTGVPHVVLEVGGIDKFPIVDIGRALRRHPAFAPEGANVNFISTEGVPARVRTYERGVEDETLACGTGATASAVVLHRLHGTRPPVRIRTRGGDVLKVGFRAEGELFEDVWLEGPARVTFTGEMTI